jgi:hypothetical protein
MVVEAADLQMMIQRKRCITGLTFSQKSFFPMSSENLWTARQVQWEAGRQCIKSNTPVTLHTTFDCGDKK